MEKPRISYSEFAASQMRYAKDSIADCIERRVKDSRKPGARQFCASKYLQYARLQRSSLSAIQAVDLARSHIIDFARERKAEGVKPVTIHGDLCCLRAVLRNFVEAEELPTTVLDAFTKAKRKLKEEQLTGKSTPRTRLPEDIEIELLRAHFEKQNEDPATRVDMVLMLDTELATGRRVSEITRIERQHVNAEKRTCWLYDMKSPNGKGEHGEFALLDDNLGGKLRRTAWQIFEERLGVIGPEPTAKLFPFKSTSCSQRYTDAKKYLRKTHPELFVDLRMHDNRAECFTEHLRARYTVEQVATGMSKHKDGGKTLVRHYMRMTAVDMHAGPAMPRALIEQRVGTPA